MQASKKAIHALNPIYKRTVAVFVLLHPSSNAAGFPLDGELFGFCINSAEKQKIKASGPVKHNFLNTPVTVFPNDPALCRYWLPSKVDHSHTDGVHP